MSTQIAAGTGSPIVFSGLGSGNYNVTVTARNSVGNSVSSSTATATVAGPPAGTWDWTSHFSSRNLFETDFYPAPNGDASGTDPASGTWIAGSGNSFYPYAFFTDSSAPAGEYLRCFCDRASQHPGDQHGGSNWIGCNATTKRDWSSGYIEFAARFPSAGSGNGMFPALWMYAQGGSSTITDSKGTYTQQRASRSATELDLLEIFGRYSNMQWTTTVHAQTGSGGGASNNTLGDLSTTKDQWHTWGVQYGDYSNLNFYYDRVQVHSDGGDAGNVSGQPLQVRIDYVSADNIGYGPPTDGSTPNSMYMDVSYVRHWANRPF